LCARLGHVSDFDGLVQLCSPMCATVLRPLRPQVIESFSDDFQTKIVAESKVHERVAQEENDQKVKDAKAAGTAVATVVPIEDLLHVYTEFLDVTYLGGVGAVIPWLAEMDGDDRTACTQALNRMEGTPHH
jgi:predicted dinucleotide-binding enzyme